MERLVCAATWEELQTYGAVPEQARDGFAAQGDVGFLRTGVGIPLALATVLETARREQPQAILNIGIAGAYPGSGLALGDIVTAEREVYGDIGFEMPEPPCFRPIQVTPFGEEYLQHFFLVPWPQVPARTGCTVNTCTGTEATGRRREQQFQAAFETMEGAAVAQAGALLGIPVREVRAISNLAARRSISPATIRFALDRLTTFFDENSHD